jgi:hypothetical protein
MVVLPVEMQYQEMAAQLQLIQVVVIFMELKYDYY